MMPANKNPEAGFLDAYPQKRENALKLIKNFHAISAKSGHTSQSEFMGTSFSICPAYSPIAPASAPKPKAKKIGFSLPACGEAAKNNPAEKMSNKSCNISTTPSSPTAEYFGNHAGNRISNEPNAIRINTRKNPRRPRCASLGISLNFLVLLIRSLPQKKKAPHIL